MRRATRWRCDAALEKVSELVVSAHLDTVFPEGTDVCIRQKDGRLYALGILDDTRGRAEFLSIIRAFNASGIKIVGISGSWRRWVRRSGVIFVV